MEIDKEIIKEKESIRELRQKVKRWAGLSLAERLRKQKKTFWSLNPIAKNEIRVPPPFLTGSERRQQIQREIFEKRKKIEKEKNPKKVFQYF